METNIRQLLDNQEHAIKNPAAMPSYQSGRSIVTSCYRSEIPGTFILLNELRRLGFGIPIEVFYREGELNENEIHEMQQVSPGQIIFKKIQSTAPDFVDRWGNTKGWSTKVYAVLESQYEENLWIDCDNVPIRNCVDLFDDEEYSKKGSMFWRDVYSIDRADQYWSGSDMWKVFGVTANDGEPFESGQFLINKPKVWTQLSLMLHFTENNRIYYQFGGDAECWRMAWQRVSISQGGYHSPFNYHASNDVPYGMMPYGPFHKGQQNPWHKYGGGTVMVQRDRQGRELFNHRNITKWKWKEENPFNDDVQNESDYHMIMRHIKAKYGVST
jgi:hypothetical protein